MDIVASSFDYLGAERERFNNMMIDYLVILLKQVEEDRLVAVALGCGEIISDYDDLVEDIKKALREFSLY